MGEHGELLRRRPRRRGLLTAWKSLELRVCRALGGERAGPQGKHGSDCVGLPYAVEVKRCTRYSLRQEWLEQARRQSVQEGKPWILVVGEHRDRAPIAVVDFAWLAGILAGEGMIGSPGEDTGSPDTDEAPRGALVVQE